MNELTVIEDLDTILSPRHPAGVPHTGVPMLFTDSVRVNRSSKGRRPAKGLRKHTRDFKMHKRLAQDGRRQSITWLEAHGLPVPSFQKFEEVRLPPSIPQAPDWSSWRYRSQSKPSAAISSRPAAPTRRPPPKPAPAPVPPPGSYDDRLRSAGTLVPKPPPEMDTMPPFMGALDRRIWPATVEDPDTTGEAADAVPVINCSMLDHSHDFRCPFCLNWQGDLKTVMNSFTNRKRVVKECRGCAEFYLPTQAEVDQMQPDQIEFSQLPPAARTGCPRCLCETHTSVRVGGSQTWASRCLHCNLVYKPRVDAPRREPYRGRGI